MQRPMRGCKKLFGCGFPTATLSVSARCGRQDVFQGADEFFCCRTLASAVHYRLPMWKEIPEMLLVAALPLTLNHVGRMRGVAVGLIGFAARLIGVALLLTYLALNVKLHQLEQ